MGPVNSRTAPTMYRCFGSFALLTDLIKVQGFVSDREPDLSDTFLLLKYTFHIKIHTKPGSAQLNCVHPLYEPFSSL